MKSIRRYFLFFTFLSAVSCSFAQQNKIDSLLILLKTDIPDTNKLFHLNNLAWEYHQIGSYDSALFRANSAMELINNSLKKSTDLKIKKASQKGESFTYNIIGLIYSDQGNYPEALKNHFFSLKIKEALGDKQGIATSYNNIGNIYDAQGNFPEVLKNYLACLEIMKSIRDNAGIASSYGNIGNIYAEQGNYSEALKNYFASLKIKNAIGDKVSQANSYNNIGIIYYFQGNYPEALKNYFISLKLRESKGDKAGISDSYGNIGAAYFEQKQYKGAEEYYNKAKELSKEIGYKENLRNAYKSLIELDSARGNFKGAYENHKLYILYRDSLDNEDTRKKTIQSQMTYDFDKKEAVADAEHKKELENQQALAEEKSRKQKVVIVFVVGGLFLVLVFAGFVFRSLRLTRKQKTVIEEQKLLVEEKQKEVLDSIYYARRIQRSLLPTEKYIDRTLKRLNKNFNR